MLLPKFFETCLEVQASFACLLDKSFFLDDINEGRQHRSGERIKLVACEMTKTCFLHAVRNFIGGNKARDREGAARPFGNDEYVRFDSVMLNSKPFSGPAKTGLGFINN